MSRKSGIEKHVPLSEATYYIMLVLMTPMHGYGVMQQVDQMTDGVVSVGAGTLYGALSTLEKDGLVEMVRKEGRRKFYELTDKGQEVLQCHLGRLELMVDNGKQVMGSATRGEG